MNRFLIISALCLIQILSLSAQEKDKAKVIEVIKAEKKFAATSAAKGMKTAFLENAADDGIVFTNKPTNAKNLWQTIPESDSLLMWKPSLAGISSGGEIGFTTGPFTFSPTKNDPPTSFGEYATIWKKQADGNWKFVLDIGIHHEKSTFGQSSEINKRKFAEKTTNKSTVWKETELNFLDFLSSEGIAASYKKYASPQIRLLREKYEAFNGKTSALNFLSEPKINLELKSIGGENLSDFAYVYGEYELTLQANSTEKGFYLQIWRLEPEGWRIALDLQLP